MTRPVAFRGDPAVKSALLAQIDRHLTAGTLIFDDTAWDGERGSAMGVSIGGTDPVAYAADYGYPLSLVVLIDDLLRWPAPGFDTSGFVRDWVSVVEPGADLAPAATRLMLSMLGDPGLSGIDDAVVCAIVALHQDELDGRPAPRKQWAAVRQFILTLPDDPSDSRCVIAARLYETAAWPAARGRSTLVSAFHAWRAMHAHVRDADWSDAEEARKDALLQEIWTDQQTARDRGDTVDYGALLAARDHALAKGYEANLRQSNTNFQAASAVIAGHCIALLHACEPVSSRFPISSRS